MDTQVRNFLFRNPQYYEYVYPEPNQETSRMCRDLFARYLAAPPASILDLGCGTGHYLDVFSRTGPECWGVDYLPRMIAFARERFPHLRLTEGDMRTVRLGRTFDAVLCMGSAFMYALDNAEVDQALETFAAHAHPGTLLVLDLYNAASYLGGAHFRETVEFRLEAPGFSATGVARHAFDRRRQLLVRERTWRVPGRPPVEDFCRYRLFFPRELEHLLAEKGFRTVGMFDNKALKETDLSDERLYVAAIKEAPAAPPARPEALGT